MHVYTENLQQSGTVMFDHVPESIQTDSATVEDKDTLNTKMPKCQDNIPIHDIVLIVPVARMKIEVVLMMWAVHVFPVHLYCPWQL